MNAAEIRKITNKILFSATKDYWDWYAAHYQLENSKLALQLASTRYRAVLQRIQLGELPRVDSLEAMIFVQDREINLNQAIQEELNARLILSSYLWSDDGLPLDLQSGTKPAIPDSWKLLPDSVLVQNWAADAAVNHPELQKFQVKTRILELDKRLAAEMLKPQLNLQYNWLSAPGPGLWYDSPVDRNYKFGLDFSFPLFLRKERGKLSLVKTKLLQNNLEISQLGRNIQIDIYTSLNQLKALEKNLLAQGVMVTNYDKLLLAEVRKFGIGESSLFIINSREAKLIESRIKLISMEAKFQKERASLLFAAGRNALSP
jgi:outer membrane protein TolC